MWRGIACLAIVVSPYDAEREPGIGFLRRGVPRLKHRMVAGVGAFQLARVAPRYPPWALLRADVGVHGEVWRIGHLAGVDPSDDPLHHLARGVREEPFAGVHTNAFHVQRLEPRKSIIPRRLTTFQTTLAQVE